jgi:hypothetical protein
MLEAALSNPNTTHRGRKHAKHELRAMVCFDHPGTRPSDADLRVIGSRSRNTRFLYDQGQAGSWNTLNTKKASRSQTHEILNDDDAVVNIPEFLFESYHTLQLFNNTAPNTL